jgi:putative chitinase
VQPTPITELTDKNLIVEIQSKLQSLGYYEDGQVDGVSGPKTEKAWRKWKSDNWLSQETIIGRSSLRMLREQYQPTDWLDFDSHVSEFFTVGEVSQWDEKRIVYPSDIKENVKELARELDEVRKAFGKPIQVTSWYRPPEVNAAVGGAINSQHITGKAADITAADLEELHQLLENKLWTNRALGWYSRQRFIHLDLRQGFIRW